MYTVFLQFLIVSKNKNKFALGYEKSPYIPNYTKLQESGQVRLVNFIYEICLCSDQAFLTLHYNFVLRNKSFLSE